MRCDPEDHPILVVLPHQCTPEYKTNISQILFETFNFPYILLRPPSSCAIASAWKSYETKSIVGCAVHFGEFSTDINIVDEEGEVIPNCSVSVPIGGNDLTCFVADLLRDREKSIPDKDLFATAKTVKERYCRAALNSSLMFQRFDKKREMYMVKHSSISSLTGKQFTFDVGYERFLALSLYFHPEMVKKDIELSLPECIFSSFKEAPIELRNEILNNIVIYGGSSNIKGIGVLINEKVQELVDIYYKKKAEMLSNRVGRICHPGKRNVIIKNSKRQHYAEWYGGAIYSSVDDVFDRFGISRNQYFENDGFIFPI